MPGARNAGALFYRFHDRNEGPLDALCLAFVFVWRQCDYNRYCIMLGFMVIKRVHFLARNTRLHASFDFVPTNAL